MSNISRIKESPHEEDLDDSQRPDAITIEQLENVDEDVISDMPWAQDLFKMIKANFKKGFLYWCKTVKDIAGTEENHVSSWKNTYLHTIDEVLCDLIEDMLRFKGATVDNVESLLVRLNDVCKELHEPFNTNVGKDQLCLFDEQQNLQKQINKYELIINAKRKELELLQKKQADWVKELGEVEEIKLSYPPLPTAEQLEHFHQHIESLEGLKFEREERYCYLRHNLIEIIEELKYQPRNEFEEMIVAEDNFKVTTINMEKLELFSKQMMEIKKSTEEQISQFRARIEELWKMLEVDLRDQDEFRSRCSGSSLQTLEVLRQEVKRCEKIKKANIEQFVVKLRDQLQNIWRKCHCSQEEQNSFQYFEDDCYTEDLMDLHELEIEKWERYYEQNEKLLNLLGQHERQWQRSITLDESGSTCDRYKNRGGKLLLEEKERNKLAKSIPKLEQQILQLSEKYLRENGRQFRTFGRTPEEYIRECHEDRENRKKLKLSARKMQRDQTAIGSSRTPLNLFPSTSRMLTPQHSSTVKRKILGTPHTENIKRLKASTPVNPSSRAGRTPRTIPKIKVTLATLPLGSQKRKSRASIESSKRRRSGRIAIAKRNCDTNQTQNTTYSSFEKDLSNKEANSTFVDFQQKSRFMVPPMNENPEGRTPSRACRNQLNSPQLRTPKGDHKLLSTCKSNLNLKF
ncbi:protein regulator of cytokinesis 1-like isoform X1 [Euwallacea fornicatus]|uniref:protein regulator of cytokinesis 1-like isoform X1 n=1 Tax=Euwallacea fornicatus TaxID=995702 RepID=UPI0033904E71